MCPNGVFFSWARLEGARLRIPVSVATRPGPTRPDRPFRPPRFRTENCRFGAVGFGPPRTILGLPKASWATDLGVPEPFWDVLGLPGQFWPSQSHFGSPKRALGPQEPLWPPRAVLGRCGPLGSVFGSPGPPVSVWDSRGSWRDRGKGYPGRPDPTQPGLTRPAISNPVEPH